MTTECDLIQRLVDIADALDGKKPLVFSQGQAMDGFTALANFQALANEARAYLSQPEPEGLTDEELLCIAAEAIDGYGNCGIKPGEYEEVTEQAVEAYGSELIAYARAVLARWGGHPGSPDSSLQPVPVSERLPEPEDCNDEGEVWAWRRFSRFSLEKEIDNCDFWCLAYHKWLEGEDGGFTHWLPAHALPLPTHD